MKNGDPKASDHINQVLAEKIRQASADGRSVGKTVVEAPTRAGKVSIVVEDADRLGVLAGSVSAKGCPPKGTGAAASVPAQAREVVKRLNYLQEPLAIIESEERRGGRAILRSAAPRQVGSGAEYNEAVVDGGDSISIRRFRSEGGSKRRAVPSNLSRETLGRLADDLVDILDKN